jgi:hypothetical protein
MARRTSITAGVPCGPYNHQWLHIYLRGVVKDWGDAEGCIAFEALSLVAVDKAGVKILI